VCEEWLPVGGSRRRVCALPALRINSRFGLRHAPGFDLAAPRAALYSRIALRQEAARASRKI
jgi:hypothetical protein